MSEEQSPGSTHGLGGAVNATVATALLGAAADLTGISPWWAAAAVAPAVAGGVRATLSGRAVSSVVYRAGCWLCAGAWVAHAAADTPWSVGSFAALAAGGVSAWLLSPVLAWRDRKVADRRALLAAMSRKRRIAEEWRLRLATVCGLRNHRIVDVAPWDNGFGYTVVVSLVGTGKSLENLRPASVTSRLATDANLPEGCGLEIGAGPSRGVVLVRVTTKDAFAEECPFPLDDLSVTSIDEPIRFGRYRDGTVAEALLRWQRLIMVGPPESGKTNQLRTIIGQILRTDDAIVRIIDLNGGGLAWPWLRVWRDEKTKQSVIDWVAPNPEEAARCAADTLWEAKRRKTEYDHLLVDDDKLPAGDGRGGNPPPAIFLIFDEGAEVGGAAATPAARAAKRDIAELIRIGRSAGVNVIQSYLRATTDITGATANKRLSGTRVLMRVQDPVEGQHLFGQNVDPQDAPYQGCGWLAEYGQDQRPFRGDRTVGRAIDTIAMATTDRRPVVHPSPNYAGRWDRIRVPGTRRSTPTAPAAPSGSTSRLDRLRQVASGFRATMDRVREQRGEIRHDPGLAARFDDVIKGLDLPDADGSRPDPRTRMVTIVRGSGRAGISAEALRERLAAEGYGVSRATLYRWLADSDEVVSGDTGWVHRDHDGGTEGVRS